MSERREIIKAIKAADVERVQTLVSAHPHLCSSDAKIRKGENALHLAAKLGLQSIVTVLLKRIEVNDSDNDGKSALHEAATYGHVDTVKLLLQHGATVDSLKAADWTPMMMACAKSHLEIVRVLLEWGASLSRVNKDGWSPFHIAAREGDVALLNYLLDQESRCWETASKNGRTPLHTAAINGRLECTELLLSLRCGYDVDCADSCGNTPLMDALRKDFVDIASLLLSHNASVYACNSLGQDALHVVSEAGAVDSLRLLKRYMTDDFNGRINQADSRGVTCLHLAAKEGHSDLISTLLSYGADRDVRDGRGRTAYDVAVMCKNSAAAQALKQ